MIPVIAYTHDIPPVLAALERARRIVWDGWIDRLAPSLRQGAEDALGGWDGVMLTEGIAEAILEAEGWDLDALDDAVPWVWDDPRCADAIATWVRRGPTLREEIAS